MIQNLTSVSGTHEVRRRYNANPSLREITRFNSLCSQPLWYDSRYSIHPSGNQRNGGEAAMTIEIFLQVLLIINNGQESHIK